jgi:hypothetical protein
MDISFFFVHSLAANVSEKHTAVLRTINDSFHMSISVERPQ